MANPSHRLHRPPIVSLSEMPVSKKAQRSVDDDEDEDDECGSPPSPDDVLKILITTDNHLGYCERDEERAHDSLIAFEECLQIARDENVDFILLGGDLFHDNKPSNHVMLECVNLLRKYCFGDKTIEFKLISDEKVNFSSTVQVNPFPWANFKDPNLNVSIPVFSIHGYEIFRCNEHALDFSSNSAIMTIHRAPNRSVHSIY